MREEYPDGGNAPIYAVDDETIIGAMIEAVLAGEGYRLKVFSDPAALLADFQSANPRPKIIITDYFMGSMNGMELLARCKQLDPGVKIILLSGTVGEDFVHEHAAQPDKFLQKPFAPKALIHIVRDLL